MSSGDDGQRDFDKFRKVVTIDNWEFTLDVDNQTKKANVPSGQQQTQYLKATLYLANIKTQRSLLYSMSKTTEDYEGMYKYLAFGCRDELCIRNGDQYIHPIGYVFEPSNGLVRSDKLVYQFQLEDKIYRDLSAAKNVEYWYTDRLVGLGKICFTQNN